MCRPRRAGVVYCVFLYSASSSVTLRTAFGECLLQAKREDDSFGAVEVFNDLDAFKA